MTEFPNLTVLDHPLIQHKLSHLRSVDTPKKGFKELVDEIAMLMAFEVTRSLQLEDIQVTTPLEEATCQRLKGKKLVLVPILRAGLGMTAGVMQLIPQARIGHLGMYRDEQTLEPVTYYNKLPKNVADTEIIVIDPMLATGNSAAAAVDEREELRLVASARWFDDDTHVTRILPGW